MRTAINQIQEVIKDRGRAVTTEELGRVLNIPQNSIRGALHDGVKNGTFVKVGKALHTLQSVAKEHTRRAKENRNEGALCLYEDPEGVGQRVYESLSRLIDRLGRKDDQLRLDGVLLEGQTLVSQEEPIVLPENARTIRCSKVTKELAEHYAKMTPFGMDRDLLYRRLVHKFFSIRVLATEFIWVQILYTDKDGLVCVVRGNGKHTAVLLWKFPELIRPDMDVIEVTYDLTSLATETAKKIAGRLYDRYDDMDSSRNASDLLRQVRDAKDLTKIPTAHVKVALGGMCYGRWGARYNQTKSIIERNALLAGDGVRFVEFMSKIIEGAKGSEVGPKHLSRHPVAAATEKMWRVDPDQTELFWNEVSFGVDKDGNKLGLKHPAIRLHQFLKNKRIGMKQPVSLYRSKREFHGMCLYAWRMWRRGQEFTKAHRSTIISTDEAG